MYVALNVKKIKTFFVAFSYILMQK